MSKYNKKTSSAPTGLITLLIALAVILVVAASVLLWLLKQDGDVLSQFAQPVEQLLSGEEQSQPEQAEAADVQSVPEIQPANFAASANADKTSVRYAASYTGGSSADGSRIVATYGTGKLTNAQLQLRYLSQVAAWRAGSNAQKPDFTQPLDTQRCPLGEGDLTWQQYFLRLTVDSWQAEQALLAGAKEPILLDDPDYKPNESSDLHGKYIAPDLPVNNFLYQNLTHYTPNKQHQAYLDGLEAQMDMLARQLGYLSLADYALKFYGGQLDAKDLVEMAKDYNYAYMFFTEYTYSAQPTQEEIENYVHTHRLDLPTETTVDFQHILLIPQGGQVAKDGTVTADENQWKACYWDAQGILGAINSNGRGDAFARSANEYSQDEGSRANGGWYTSVSQGQMIPELDEWCFDSDRTVGDTDIIRSSLGYHIVKLRGIHSAAEAAAQRILLLKNAQQKWCSGQLTVDWSQVSLWTSQTPDGLTLADLLYPDVAHERFPEAIVYLQQDFMRSPFGDGTVGTNGCGITTFAMLSTYMTDSIKTPAAMARDFRAFFVGTGTDAMIFRDGAASLGFFMEKSTNDVNEVIDALLNGQRVISLQRDGHFTSTGHFLLVQNYYPETDTFQVRDSNVYNYGRLKGHQEDAFTRQQLNAACTNYWIMQPKPVRTPACTRCGDPTVQSAPELLLQEDYFCPRCVQALERRECFLALGS